MKTLVKQFIDHDLSRRDFAQAMMAVGFTGTAIQSVLSSVAYAQETPPGLGFEFTGSGGEVLAECLKAAGVEYVFDVNSTGQSAFYDALSTRPGISMIVALQEGQATSMAQGYELASGKTAVLFVPSIGIPNALSNLYNAWKDRSAIAVLSDGQDTATDGRDGFQQVDDWLEPTEQFTKWRWQLDNPDRIGELTRRVIKLAGTPPGGPVYLRLPNNVLSAQNLTQTIYPQSSFTVSLDMAPNPALIEAAAQLLVNAQNPMISAAGEVTRAGANDDLIELAELLAIRVAQGYSVFADFPYSHPLFIGNYGMGFPPGVGQTDVFLNLGGLMPDSTIFTSPLPKAAKVIHARVDYEAIANTQPTDVAIAGGMKETIRGLIDSIKSTLTKDRIEAIRADRWAKANADMAANAEKKMKLAEPKWNTSPLQTERLSYEMNAVLDPNAIVLSETGDRTPFKWIDLVKGGRKFIGQSTGFALGWSVGASLGAKIAQPDRQVVTLVGDGAFLFGQIESLWTASRYDIPVTIVVFNNQSYDSERNRIMLSSQLARANKASWKDMASFLGDPVVDYVGLAKSFGIDGAKVEQAGDVKATFERAAAVNREGRPFIVDAVLARRGLGAESAWHPEISIAGRRTQKI